MAARGAHSHGHGRHSLLHLALLLGGAAMAKAAPGPRETPAPAPHADVTRLDLEELLRVRVTSAARKAQGVSEVPAAIHVIRREDLERSGATTLAEALRAIPGIQVARFRSSGWAITARGFNDTVANKLLVLIDGRSVYSPLHSGVFWDTQDTRLDEVDRIEVIRGPGGSLWGGNAINGVVNVITRTARESRGAEISASVGSEERARFETRYGFPLGASADGRAWFKFTRRDGGTDGLDDDSDARDGWSTAQIGMRSDWQAGPRDRLVAMADYYEGQRDYPLSLPTLEPPHVETRDQTEDVRGANVLLRWQRHTGADSDLTLAVYGDHAYRRSALYRDKLHTADVDFQHRFSPAPGHELVWGLGYRLYRSEFAGSLGFRVEPRRHTDHVLSAFAQDEVELVRRRLRLTLGAKVEHNEYSGLEAQPSIRLAWTSSTSRMAWVAVSRAVRTPSLVDVDGELTPVVLPGLTPTAVTIFGSDDFRSEELIAFEAGFRTRPVHRLSLDLAVFRNRYNRLRSGEIGTPFAELEPEPPHAVVPIALVNGLHGHTWGAELAANLQASPSWLVQLSYAWLTMDVSEEEVNGRSPRNTLWLRSALALSGRVKLDLIARYVSRLRAFDIDSYLEADLRLAWSSGDGKLEASIAGQNLLHDSHAEFDTESRRSDVARGVLLGVRRTF